MTGKSVLDRYQKLEKIGEGTYGKVYKARNSQTGELVALKKTRLEIEEEGVPATALREVALLQLLSKSRYVVRLLSVEHVHEIKKPVLYLIFEYCDTDLKKYIDKRSHLKVLPKQTVQSFLYQMLQAVAYMHSHGVMHRDLKPQNILVNEKDGICKIADLGLGRAFSVPIKSYTHEIVTLWYRAPEVLLGGAHYATPVDIWSLGCIFAEMARMQPLFPGDSELQQLLHIFKLLGTPTETIWHGVTQFRDWHEYPVWHKQDLGPIIPELDAHGIDLLQRMLQYSPANRISAKDALRHPYFDAIDRSALKDAV